MLEKDVVLAKVSSIERYLKTIQLATKGNPESLDDVLVQDVFVLNVQRAAQACIDIAHAVIAARGLSLPKSYREAFEILQKDGLIQPETTQKMIKMAGFRNIAVHDYEQIDVDILKSILQGHLGDFEEFYQAILDRLDSV